MRIISSFKDFYDGCRGYGFDPKLVYVRKTKEIPIDWNEHREIKEREMLTALSPLSCIYGDMPSLGGRWRSSEYKKGVIAFCGVAFPYYEIEGKCLYRYDKIIAAIHALPKSEHKQELIASLDKPSTSHRWGGYRSAGHLNLASWKQFGEETNFSLGDDIHRYFKSPVILHEGRRIIINPSLKDHNFATQVAPYQAYQELSMYVGNNLANQMDPEVHVNDKIKAESRGFDKWSFRTHKEDSKKPRNK